MRPGRFDQEMRGQFNVHNKYHKYLPTSGWSYGYGRSYNCELLTVTVSEDCFGVLGVSVKDNDSLQIALKKAKKAYDGGYEERYAEICAKRRASQIERTKKRVEREKTEMEKLYESADPDKLNRFKWTKKVSRSDLFKLYQGESKGLIDEVLLDDIGLTFYLRMVIYVSSHRFTYAPPFVKPVMYPVSPIARTLSPKLKPL